MHGIRCRFHVPTGTSDPVTGLAFALAVPVLAFGLLLAVIGRKARRDRAERLSRQRRLALDTSSGAELSALVSSCLRDTRWGQTDLLEALRRADNRTVDRLVAAVDPIVADRVIAVRVAHRDPVVRGRAVLTAAWLGSSMGLSAAVRLLSDSDPDVRLAACAALEIIRTPAAAEAMIAALDDGIVPSARLIERLGASWAVPSLLTALPQTSSGSVRAACLRALGLAGDRAAVEAVSVYLTSGDVEERISAARSLSQIGDPRCGPGVLAALADERWEVRAQAANALGELIFFEAVDGLVRALSDRAWWVRASAAHSLARLGPAGRAALQAIAEGQDRYAAERAEEELQILRAAA